MGLNLTITAGRVSAGTQLPGSAQALANFMATWNGIGGTSNFNGVNFGNTTPTADQRGYPWFKTDMSNNPVGWFAWNGTAWAAIPVQAASGPSISRPGSPGAGTEYYDTTIGAVIIWNGGNWTTLSGTIGDVKEVFLPTLDQALTNNPGWIQEPTSIGCVLAAAGPATAISTAQNYGTVIGEEQHTLLTNEMPSHTHTSPVGASGAAATGNVGNPSGILSDRAPTVTGATGGGAGHNNIQPTVYVWRLIKTS